MKKLSRCRLCGGTRSVVVYEGPVRAGAFGVEASGHRVLECRHCKVQRLEPAPADALAAYTDGSYRAGYDGSAEAADFHRKHDKEQSLKLSLVGLDNLRGKAVADVGCGAGAFLDVAGGAAARTVAVEPMKAYHPHLKKRFDSLYGDDDALAKGESGKLGLVTAFAVVEHVADPLAFLKNLRASLAKGGRLIVTTPNRDEILMRLHAERFRPFFYRTAHLWYFNAASLQSLGRRAGLKPVSTRTFHTYDLSNLALWLRDGRPTGQGRAPEFGPVLDAAWRGHLEVEGWADQLLAVFERP